MREREREGGREKAGKGKSKEEMSAVRRSSFFKCERTRERAALCGASRDSRVSSIKRNSRKGEFHKLTVIATRFISDALLSQPFSRAPRENERKSS